MPYRIIESSTVVVSWYKEEFAGRGMQAWERLCEFCVQEDMEVQV